MTTVSSSDASGEIDVTEPSDAASRSESVGRYLSRQRRLRGISLEELSDLTRIPIRSLERLEAGRFDGEADGFVRGFVRTVGEALGLDPDDAVARLLDEVQVESDAEGTVIPLRRAGAVVLAAAVLATLLAVGRWAVGAATATGPSRAPVVYRQDPVRALADAVAAQGGADATDSPMVAPPSSARPSEPRRTAEARRP